MCMGNCLHAAAHMRYESGSMYISSIKYIDEGEERDCA
jgi:hypothetical protein